MNTPQIELTDIQKEVMVQHQTWMMNPMTKTLKHILNEHEKTLVINIADIAMNMNVEDANVRALAINLKAVQTIKKLIFTTEIFAAKSGN